MTQDVEARRIVSPGFRRTLTLAGLVCGLFAGMAPMGASAQQTIFVGKGQPNDVIIDLSVLDKLGPPPRLQTKPRRTSRRAASPAESNPFVVLTPPPAPPPSEKTASTSAPSTPSSRTTMPLVPTPAPQAAAQTPSPAPAPAPAAPATTSPMATSTPSTGTSAAPPPSSMPPTTTAAPESEPAAETAAATPPAPVPATPSPSAAAAPTPPAAQEPAPTTPQPAPVASAAPEPAPAQAPSASPPAQMAAVPPPAATGKSTQAGQALSVNFASGSSDLSDSAKGSLNNVIGTMKQDAEARLQLLAYAAGTEDQASQARRLSLTRALAVRTYLIDKGIASTRIDVRALGNKVEGAGPADRVDLVFTNK